MADHGKETGKRDKGNKKLESPEKSGWWIEGWERKEFREESMWGTMQSDFTHVVATAPQNVNGDT